jgi:adenosylcobinamide-phosphate synthase
VSQRADPHHSGLGRRCIRLWRARSPQTIVSVTAGSVPPRKRYTTTLPINAFSAAVGILADLAFGEPATDPHPVAAFGTVMERVEQTLYHPRRSSGVLHAAVGLTLGIAAGSLVRSTTLATYVSVAQKALTEAGLDVATALEDDDLPRARQLLPALVGRDPSGLDVTGISRAVVESLAENTVDAVVAPALWGALFGAPGTLGYRAVNTMDATVGYRNERYQDYGWASARLDDVANFVPARLTAALVVAARPRSAPEVWRAVRQDAPAHPSPNSGVAEAAFAAALGLRLGGVNTYGSRTEDRAHLGRGRAPEASDIFAAAALCRDVTRGLIGSLLAFAALARVRARARQRGGAPT